MQEQQPLPAGLRGTCIELSTAPRRAAEHAAGKVITAEQCGSQFRGAVG
jgi:hypothetical protein